MNVLPNGWPEHKGLVLYRLDELKVEVEQMDRKLDSIDRKVT